MENELREEIEELRAEYTDVCNEYYKLMNEVFGFMRDNEEDCKYYSDMEERVGLEPEETEEYNRALENVAQLGKIIRECSLTSQFRQYKGEKSEVQ